MPKFKKGDRVVSVKTGAKGVVDEVYGEEKYAVLFDGAANPDRVEGFQIRLANSRACNGKFKVGDKVWVPAKQKRGVIRGVSATGNQYDVEFMGGGGAYVNEEGLEFLQALGNSDSPVSTNSVVRNAMAARTARNAETASQIAAKASKDADELEAMVKKATPWRNEMKRMRSRYEQIADWWAAVPPKDDPDYGKAVAAMQRREKAMRAADDLWYSIERS